MRILSSLLLTALIAVLPLDALAQRGHVSEMQHRTDSLFQMVTSVSRMDRPAVLKHLRVKVDSLRERHELSSAFIREMMLGPGVSMNPMGAMKDSTFTTTSRANVVLQYEYIAHLVVLDSLWQQYAGSTQQILRPEDLLIVHEHLRGVQEMRATVSGNETPYDDLSLETRSRISRKIYDQTFPIRQQVMLNMPTEQRNRMLERARLEEVLLQRLLR